MLTFLIPTAKEMAKPDLTIAPPFPDSSQPIVNHLLSLSESELCRAYHLKEEATEKEITRLQAINDGSASYYPAYQLFNGLMYRHIKRDALSRQENDYLLKHVYITSSMYGIIPMDYPIAEHRLDFQTKVKIEGQSLKHYWRPSYDQFITEDKVIVSLLSSEFEDVFSKFSRKLWISVRFMEEKNGQLKTHSTISKKARGAFITATMESNCQNKKDLEALVFKGFSLDINLSDDKLLTYIKKEA